MGEKKLNHIILTSHPSEGHERPPEITWGAATAKRRGPVIATTGHKDHRNVIGTHSGPYMVYRALAVAAGKLDPYHRPDLTNTAPAVTLGPHATWKDPRKIVSLDPYGAMVGEVFKEHLDQGFDIRPTIAITQAHIEIPEFKEGMRTGRLKPDGEILLKDGSIVVTKIAIEPVWYLPGVAERFDVDESTLRRCLFEHTGGMFPELVTRPDLNVLLPPIGGNTIYLFGNPKYLGQSGKRVTCRVHDECNGSDVFGSDICTCRPYLTHGIEMCIEEAQNDGIGIIVYNRKEGRALGEVTKFLVYNARKRAKGGDTAESYFERTECVAGVQDMRFQELMPDPLHWLGVTRIDRFVSMSNMKYDALVGAGIKVKDRISIPDELIPADASVEMEAKKAAGYFTPTKPKNKKDLKQVKGRKLD